MKKTIETRNVSPNHIVKFNVDGGGGFLNMSLGVLVKEQKGSGPPTKCLLTTTFLKTSDVKKQLLVAVSRPSLKLWKCQVTVGIH